MQGITELAIERASVIKLSPRVLQLSSLYDVPPAEKSFVRWTVDMPLVERDWSIGLIVGPSGCGKTTIAREIFGSALIDGFNWSDSESVVDGFPHSLSIKEIIGYLGAVGFNSPPSWLRPYRVLSTGEQFRVTIARALAEPSELVAIDEFTSVVDRQVAQIASASVAKAIRKTEKKLVAISCHHDIVDWLQPDWIYEPQINRFAWRSLQCRPALDFRIYSIDRSAWQLFSEHHYMTASLHAAAQCFGGYLGDQLVAFSSYIHFPHPKNKRIKMGHRLVVLPDYQGLGLGGTFDDWLGEYLFERGFEYHNVVAHPAMVAHYSKSPRWELARSGRGVASGRRANSSLAAHNHNVSIRRVTSTFVYKAKARE